MPLLEMFPLFCGGCGEENRKPTNSVVPFTLLYSFFKDLYLSFSFFNHYFNQKDLILYVQEKDKASGTHL